MRALPLLHWLLRVQVIVGVVQFVGMFVGFAWPAPVWAAHRLIALAAPAVALVVFRRSAWGDAARPTPPLQPGLRVAARVALLAPLALGLCFSAGVLGGRGWATAHVVIALAAIAVVGRAAAALSRTRDAGTGTPAPERPMPSSSTQSH